jgi:hypothetical protein
MADEKSVDEIRPVDNASARYRRTACWVIGALVILYTIGVLSGCIGPQQRIDAVHLAMIGIACLAIFILIRPELLDRFKTLDFRGFKIEMLERKQLQQESRLDQLALVLPLLLPETERRHLFKLYTANTAGYTGRGSLRAELRRLRSIGLIRMVPHRYIGHIKDDLVFDFGDYVELTDLGRRWIKKIEEIEKADAADRLGKEV